MNKGVHPVLSSLIRCSQASANSMPHDRITTNAEYLNLIPTLSQNEFEALKQSIKKDGEISVPIIINDHNVILDGHHRARACKELGIPAKTVTKKFKDKLDEKQFVIEVNLRRRHLNEFQKAEMGTILEEIEAKGKKTKDKDKDRDRGKTLFKSSNKAAVKKATDNAVPIAQSQRPHALADIIAKKVGISRSTYERSKKILQKGSEEQKIALRKGDLGVRKVYSQIRRDEKRQELITNAARERHLQAQQRTTLIPDDGSVQLYNTDFRKLTESQIRPESIDMIFTDPPFTADSLSLYGDLAKYASIWLKEGASLVCYAGHYALPTILDYMRNYNLQFWWIMCVKHSGAATRMHNQRLRVRWKPLLWFVKGPRGTRPSSQAGDFDDLIQSKVPEEGKVQHEWEQSTVEAEYMIDNLTVTNQIVLDTFMGSGSTGVAAVRLHRRFVGCEIDATFCNTAEHRIRTTRC